MTGACKHDSEAVGGDRGRMEEEGGQGQDRHGILSCKPAK